MMNNLNSTETAEAVEHIGDHGDFGMHETMADGKQLVMTTHWFVIVSV